MLMPLQSVNVVCEIEFVEIEFMPFGNMGDCISAFELGIVNFEFNWHQLGHVEIVALAYGCFLRSLLVVEAWQSSCHSKISRALYPSIWSALVKLH